VKMPGDTRNSNERTNKMIIRSRSVLALSLILLCLMFTNLIIAEGSKKSCDSAVNKLDQSLQPELFLPGILSTGLKERDTAISPEGTEIYYTIQGPRWVIACITRKKNKWTEPQIASFSGKYNDIEPAFTPDGKKLFFASNRPLNGISEPKKDFDIWYVERTKDGWSEPVNIGAPVNTDKNEFYPSLTKDGSLFLTAAYKDSRGKEDLYVSRLVNSKYSTPENLGDKINTKLYEYNAFIAPDESYIIFGSAGRKGGLGRGDLYISFKDKDGKWGRAVNMGDNINSSAIDFCPYVSSDGNKLFFTSSRKSEKQTSRESLKMEEFIKLCNGPQNGNSDIYWIDAKIISEIKYRICSNER